MLSSNHLRETNDGRFKFKMMQVEQKQGVIKNAEGVMIFSGHSRVMRQDSTPYTQRDSLIPSHSHTLVPYSSY